MNPPGTPTIVRNPTPPLGVFVVLRDGTKVPKAPVYRGRIGGIDHWWVMWRGTTPADGLEILSQPTGSKVELREIRWR